MITFKLQISVAAAVLMLGHSVLHAAPCAAKSFMVKNINSKNQYGKAVLTATVTNNNKTACGVQIKSSSYDKNGVLIDTNDFWPASIRNIDPGASENFKTQLRADRAAKTYDLVPIDTRVW